MTTTPERLANLAKQAGENWLKFCLVRIRGSVHRETGNVFDHSCVEATYDACAAYGHLAEFDAAWEKVKAECAELAARPKCPSCDGRGVVVCDMDHEHDCRRCDGEGRLSRKAV